MKEYLVKYSGAVIVHAETEEEATDKAWIDEGVHAEDIESITTDNFVYNA